MIEGIERNTPSDKAKCNKCGKLIGKGTPRGFKTYIGSNYRGYRYFCHKCSLIKIDNDIRETTENLKGLKKELIEEIKNKKEEIKREKKLNILGKL